MVKGQIVTRNIPAESLTHSLMTTEMLLILTLSQTSPGFYVSAEQVLKTLGKGEIARNEFYTHWENFLPFSSNLKLSSANSFNLEESKICRLGKS